LLSTYLRGYWPQIAIIFVFQLVATAASLYLPTLNARIIDDGVATGDTDAIWRNGGFMLAMSLVQGLSQIVAVYFASRVAMGFGRDVRAALFDKVFSFSTKEVNQFGAPSLITRNTNDVFQVQTLVFMTGAMVLSAPITMVGGVFMALGEDVGMSWLIVASVALLAVIITVLIVQMTPLFKLQQTRIDVINRVLREQLTGIRVIRAFVREKHEHDRFAVANVNLTDTATHLGRRMMTMFPAVMFIMNISTVGVMWFGGLRIDEGHLQIGQLTAFINYLMQILMSVMMATFMFMIAPRAAVCSARIQEVLNTEPSVVPPEHGVTELLSHGEVQLDAVDFTYPGAEEPVLHDVSFTVRAGQTTAIIGSTGSGKTTLVNLLVRLFDATGGQVLIDGVNVRELDPTTLWEHVGLVPQRPYLFNGTVASNLRYGRPDATDDELWHALEIAQAADFVEAMPEGLDAPIAQGGTNVSGGQRQRLSIARALVKQPDVYVFDDSFSALDVATDARLRDALAGETHQAAVVIVAQRVSSIRHADQIVVLDEGRIVGLGTHDELVRTCPTYAEIVESQFQSTEVAA
jgi:ATP-binding cassette subfamily B protein